MDHNNNSPTIGTNKEMDILSTTADPVDDLFGERESIIKNFWKRLEKLLTRLLLLPVLVVVLSVQYIYYDDADFLTWEYFANDI
jgi:hypothetical protein